MSGPSVMVRILADMTGASKGMDDLGSKGTSAAGHLNNAFGGVLDTLNSAGVLGPFGNALQTAQSGLEKVAGHAKEIGPAMMGAGAAVAGVGLALQAAGSKDQAAHQQLQQAVEATGRSYDDYSGKVEAAIKHQENYGHTADQTQDALRALTTATNDPAKALQLLGTASDLAAAKHEDLATAAGQLGKAYNGSTRIMKEFGVTVDSTKESQAQVTKASQDHEKAVLGQAAAQAQLTAAQAAYNAQPTEANLKKLEAAQGKVSAANLTALTSNNNLKSAQDKAKETADKYQKAVGTLGDKLKGQASAGADTFSGKLDGLKAKVEDQVAMFGQKYGPAITTAGAAMTGLGATMEIAKAGVALFKDQEIIATTMTYAWAAALAVLDALEAASGITLIIIAIVALIAIVVVIIAHFYSFGAVLNWVKAIGIDVAQALVVAWNAVYGFFARIVGDIGGFFSRMWGDVAGGAQAAVGAVVGVWNSFIGFFAGIPGSIARIASGMWNGILSAFHAMVNGIIDVWNKLHFTLPDIHFGPINIGGETIGVPTLPHLAQGGLITSTGLVYAHAGEAISPIPNGIGGPAVHIDNVNVSTELDVDLFMRRAAWVAQTARL